MSAPVITAAMLRAAGACSEQREAFAAEWPDGCELNAETAARAVALGLDLDWFAVAFLSATALAAYKAATAPALVAAWDNGRGAK